MNKITSFLLIIMIALSFGLRTTMPGRAQDKSFSGVMPFMTTANRLGFFDQRDGRVYMYDDNLSQCLFIGQMTSLGKKIEVLNKQKAGTNLLNTNLLNYGTK